MCGPLFDIVITPLIALLYSDIAALLSEENGRGLTRVKVQVDGESKWEDGEIQQQASKLAS